MLLGAVPVFRPSRSFIFLKVYIFLEPLFPPKNSKTSNKEPPDHANTLETKTIKRSISKVISKHVSNYVESKLKSDQSSAINIFSYLIYAVVIVMLTLLQVIFIHSKILNSFDYRLNLENNPLIETCCDYLDKYLFEELVYLLFVSINCIVFLILKKKRRFSEAIMKKHHKTIIANEAKVMEKKKKPKFFENMSDRFTLTPSIPFSHKGRSNTAVVYILYTYDVLNIIVSIYAESISVSFLSNVAKWSGILVDLFFQLLQVFLIGVKFYPILVAADADPNFVVYFLTFIYLFFIFMIRLLNKAFCSRRQDFAKRTLTKLSSDFTSKLKQGLEFRYNISNRILNVLSDDPNPNEKYLHALKGSIPSLFREKFAADTGLAWLNVSERVIMNNFPMPSNYYHSEQAFSGQLLNSTNILINTTKRVFIR